MSASFRHPETCAVILAAGKGTRMGSDLAKVLHPLGGRALLAHVLTTCANLGVGSAVVVVGHQREVVSALAHSYGAQIAIQDKQLGTGHAVLVSESVVKSDVVLVLCGDCPLTPPELLHDLIELHHRHNNACTAVAANLPDPTGYGRMIVDGNGQLRRIVEHRDATPAERDVTLINSGIYCFRRSYLFDLLRELRPENAQGEYYLTDVVKLLVERGERVGLQITNDAAAVLGVNTPADLANAERLLAARNAQ